MQYGGKSKNFDRRQIVEAGTLRQRAVYVMYVSLTEGDEAENMCAFRLKTMYGIQDASHVWQQHYTKNWLERCRTSRDEYISFRIMLSLNHDKRKEITGTP